MSNPRETISPIEKLTEAELEAYNILVPEHKAHAILPELFTDYKDVESDLIEVSRREANYEKQSQGEPHKIDTQKRGELFEALLSNQIELSDWFGENASTIVPSRFDDIMHGVDLITEFQIEGFYKHLGLTMDATTFVPSIAKKINKIREDIFHGHLTEIKYFISESSGFRGRLQNIPKVVVGSDPITVREVSGIWLNLEKTRTKMFKLEAEAGKDHPEVVQLRTQVRSFQKRLAEHRLQFQLLQEIKVQLEYFANLAKTEMKDELYHKYLDTLGTIDDILSKKELELSEDERLKIEQDNIYRAILKEVA